MQSSPAEPSRQAPPPPSADHANHDERPRQQDQITERRTPVSLAVSPARASPTATNVPSSATLPLRTDSTNAHRTPLDSAQSPSLSCRGGERDRSGVFSSLQSRLRSSLPEDPENLNLVDHSGSKILPRDELLSSSYQYLGHPPGATTDLPVQVSVTSGNTSHLNAHSDLDQTFRTAEEGDVGLAKGSYGLDKFGETSSSFDGEETATELLNSFQERYDELKDAYISFTAVFKGDIVRLGHVTARYACQLPNKVLLTRKSIGQSAHTLRLIKAPATDAKPRQVATTTLSEERSQETIARAIAADNDAREADKRLCMSEAERLALEQDVHELNLKCSALQTSLRRTRDDPDNIDADRDLHEKRAKVLGAQHLELRERFDTLQKRVMG